jgi:amino acid adenylation domain-containing protein
MKLAGNMAEALWHAAERVDGGRPALLDRAGSTGYRELRDRASAVAEALETADVAPGDRVAIFLERGPTAVGAYYGVLAAGAAAVIVNETLRPRQIEYILNHSGARVLIASEALLRQQPRSLSTGCTSLLVEALPARGRWSPVDRIGGDLAQIIYTSGSTGQPKGVALSHGNLGAGVASVTTYLGLESTDRLASLLPFSFDYGLNQLLCAVELGATLVVERSPLPQQIVQSLRSLEVTVLPAVPPLWHQLLNVADFVERPLPALRLLTNTGGHLAPDAVRLLRRSQPQADLYLMYGLTEAFRSTFLPPEEADRRPGSIGRAIPGAEILVLRDDGTPCDPDEPGELVHRGPTVALGYWKDPGATAQRYRPNPLRPEGTPDVERVVFSGDLVQRDGDGFLYFVGRRDRMIKTLGFRVSPDEVAAVLHGSGEVLEVVVGSEPDPARGERIVAYVVLRERGSVERLRGFAATELPRYMQPARYEVRAELPRTSSGKHDLAAAQAAGSR